MIFIIKKIAAEHYEIQAKEGGVEEMYVYAVLLE